MRQTFILMAAIAYVEARFGQEQVPIAAISAVKGGSPGQAATIAGAAISDLLGAASSCAKLSRADEIFTKLGGGADALAAAIGMVTAEKNTNPSANNNTQNVCGDASLPATAELRGITPLIDPAVDVDGKAAALSKSSAAAPLKADGLSVFDLMSQNGLGDLVKSQAAAGGAAAAAGGRRGWQDAVARGGQGEALNPDIITNALCNQLTNVCKASAAGVAKCKSAQAAVKGGPRNKSTADKFNTLIGFPGAVTNPKGGPADVPAAGAAAGAAKAAKRSMRRGVRA
ncbi:circumsporozoite precursor [Pyrenophora seminiperda CCB06]|uniref:Circumsporozoite n=1 Tax=Pyrenophora seminiperda CCB06 TaxID=1302712 RepID=A0A3M7M7V3_9PLEO|nr:circumsporozoite precursor [Pyrenophora seminiperda CCB06]